MSFWALRFPQHKLREESFYSKLKSFEKLEGFFVFRWIENIFVKKNSSSEYFMKPDAFMQVLAARQEKKIGVRQ